MLKRIDLPMTHSEAMILWGVMDRLALPEASAKGSDGVTVVLTKQEQTEMSWVHARLAKLCVGETVVTVPKVAP